MENWSSGSYTFTSVSSVSKITEAVNKKYLKEMAFVESHRRFQDPMREIIPVHVVLASLLREGSPYAVIEFVVSFRAKRGDYTDSNVGEAITEHSLSLSGPDYGLPDQMQIPSPTVEDVSVMARAFNSVAPIVQMLDALIRQAKV